MKKFLISLSFIFITLLTVNAETYQITDTNFDITGVGFKFLGKTNEYSILKNYPIDKKRIFKNREEFLNYIENYKKSLLSSRAFDTVDLNIEYDQPIPDQINSLIDNNNSDNLINATLNFKILDSHHLLVMPYPKYSSNDGFNLKLKCKDTNFLGSLNTMSCDISMNFSNKGISPELNFTYDHPFKMGIFDVQWVNDYEISYIIGNTMPEWNLKTGFDISLPLDNYSLKLSLYQFFNREEDYKTYNDDIFFREEAAFSVPVKLFTLSNFSIVTYTPTLQFDYYWDFDGINLENDSIQSKILTFNHKLENSKITWEDCFRTGYSFALSNSYAYYFDRKDFSPSVSFDAKLYYSYKTSEKRKFLERFGINAHLYAFTYLYAPGNNYDYGEQIGSYLRGILDSSFFGNTKPEYTASQAVIFSLDLPHHMFTTNFKHDILNFNLQISPFVDVALTHNRQTGNMFNVKEGYYCVGAEFLVYPLKWSSYTIRASVGFDVRSVLNAENIIKGLLKYNEIFVGIGLQY
ncbi:MAG: hypothetical protein K6C97_04435 [Treponema sp.]|nr:hypothetical protein [Treponema sp.]